MTPAIHRAVNARYINSIVNHPSVRPHVGISDGDFDLTDLVKDPNNVAIEAAGGAVIFHYIGDGRYAVHVQFVEGYRGKHALGASRAAVRWLFESVPSAKEIIAFIPITAPGSAVIARYVGFKYRGLYQNAWPYPGGPVPAGFFVLTRDAWGARHGH